MCCYLYPAIDGEGHTLDIQIRRKRDHRHIKRRFVKSAGFQSLRYASLTIKGIETIQAMYKKKRSLYQPNFVFSISTELQKLLAIA